MRLVIDANGGIMGRVAGYAAKQSLLGKEVVVLNCNGVLVTGDKAAIVARYQKLKKMGGWSVKRGPTIQRSPERLMKKAIRGMVPHKKGRGNDAMKRIKCYNTTPAEFEKEEKIILKRDLKVRAHTLKKIGELI